MLDQKFIIFVPKMSITYYLVNSQR